MSSQMSESNNDMREFWNGIGGHKWINYQKILNSSLETFGREAMIVAKATSCDHVLDIGCGCGDTSIEIARKVGPKGKVTGIDVSEVILNQAQEHALTMTNLNFECVDAQYYDFDPQVCDLAYSRFGVMFFDDPGAALGNIRKALKPGGRMVFVCWQPVKNNQWINLPLDIAAKFLAPPPPSGPEVPGPFSFGETKRITEILEIAGFNSISISPYNAKFNLGKNSIEAADFISSIGPSSYLMDNPDTDEITKTNFINDLRQTLALHETRNGIDLNAATWIVSAFN